MQKVVVVELLSEKKLLFLEFVLYLISSVTSSLLKLTT